MLVSDRTVYGCRCCTPERNGRARGRKAARRTIKRRQRVAWKREVGVFE